MPDVDATPPSDANANADADAEREAAGRFVERFAGVLTDSGVPRMPSRVFAALLATDDARMTAAELAATLQVSPAAISGAVRYLTQVGLIERLREPGARRDQYHVYEDVWAQSIAGRDQLLARWQRVLGDGVDVLGAGSPAGVRLADMVDYFAFLRERLPVLAREWQAQRDAAQQAQASADEM